MKLYSGPISLFTAKVRIALDEKQLGYERVEVGWTLSGRYEPHHPDVVALNPKRQVPVLVDGELVVYDSTLILEYLEERYPDPPLHPAGAAERARCRQLEAAADEILFPHVWDLIEEAFYPSTSGVRDAARIERARAGIDAYQGAREKDLVGRPFLCGAGFSVADIGNFVFLQAASTLGAPIGDEHPGLRAWLQRVGSRPAVHKDQAAMQAFVRSVLS